VKVQFGRRHVLSIFVIGVILTSAFIMQILPSLGITLNVSSVVVDSVDVDSFCYFPGDVVQINGHANASSVDLEIFDPDGTVFFSDTASTNSTGFYSKEVTVPKGIPAGEYIVKAKVAESQVSCIFTLLDTEGFKPAILPYKRVHNGIEYTITNRSLTAKLHGEVLEVHFPSLPRIFGVEAFNNSMILTVRMRNDALNLKIDANFIFIHQGLKILINGSIAQPSTFAFRFNSPLQITKNRNSISSGHIIFNWEDLVKYGNPFTYDSNTRELAVTIPKTFRIDPIIFQTGFEVGDPTFDGDGSTSGGSAQIVTDEKHHGERSLKCTRYGEGQAYKYEYIGQRTLVYYRFYVMFDSFTLSGYNIRLGSIRYASSDAWPYWASLLVWNDGGTYKFHFMWWQNDAHYSEDISGITLQLHVWYCIEFKVKVDSSNGEAKCWINGELKATKTGIDNTHDQGRLPRYVHCGFDWCNPGSVTVEGYFDCVKVADYYIGPEYSDFKEPIKNWSFEDGSTWSASGTYSQSNTHFHGKYSWYTSGGGDYKIEQWLTLDVVTHIRGRTVTFGFNYKPDGVLSDGSKNKARAEIYYETPGGSNTVVGDWNEPKEVKWYECVQVKAPMPGDVETVKVIIHGTPDFKSWVDLAYLCVTYEDTDSSDYGDMTLVYDMWWLQIHQAPDYDGFVTSSVGVAAKTTSEDYCVYSMELEVELIGSENAKGNSTLFSVYYDHYNNQNYTYSPRDTEIAINNNAANAKKGLTILEAISIGLNVIAIKYTIESLAWPLIVVDLLLWGAGACMEFMHASDLHDPYADGGVGDTIIKEKWEYGGQSSESLINVAGGQYSFEWNFKSDPAYDFQIQITATVEWGEVDYYGGIQYVWSDTATLTITIPSPYA